MTDIDETKDILVQRRRWSGWHKVSSSPSKMKVVLWCAVFIIPLVTGHDNAPNKHCTEDNEVWSECGNLCEDNCENTCAPSFFLKYHELQKKWNRHCKPGCYCAPGYIRDEEGECVFNMPGVCDDDRCAEATKYAVYVRCADEAPRTCFRPKYEYSSKGYIGRCMCMKGFSMNSKQQCVKTKSRACKREANKTVNLMFLKDSECWDDKYELEWDRIRVKRPTV